MRASDLLTDLSVDMKYLMIERISLEEKGRFLSIKEICLIDQILLITGVAGEEGLPIKDILLILMLHKQHKLYKGTGENCLSVYGYRFKENEIIL